MSVEDDLLRAVLDDPDSDFPRLVYAQWFDQQEDEVSKARAEFILAQIELARMDPEIISTGRAFGAQNRVAKLRDRYGDRWAGDLAEIVEGYSFQRGFIGQVTMSARNFLDHGERMFSLAPIQHLDLTGVRDVNEALFFSPLLGKLRSLVMDDCGLHDLHLQMLAASPEVTNLRWLSVAENNLGMAAAEALAGSRYLKALEFAEFRANPVDPVEQLGRDSGIVVASWLPPEGEELEKRFGHLPWLHRDGEERRY